MARGAEEDRRECGGKLRGGIFTCRRTHQVSETIQLLAEHTRLISPARNLSIQEIEEEAREGENERRPEVVLVVC